MALAIGSALLGAVLVAVARADESAARHVVEMSGFGFRPAHVSVEPGDTIVWVNRDALPHTATSTAAGWDSGEMTQGASWSLVVEGVGVVDYICAYHPTMRGTIEIAD